MNELFEIPESLSPLAKWKRKHSICVGALKSVINWDSLAHEEALDPEEDKFLAWRSCDGTGEGGKTFRASRFIAYYTGTGPTEAEACADIARKCSINHWSLDA